ncbi:ABC transporter substrate-binding protein [Agaribacterium sp. ZY112]|uniref:ABC transporter substrate-binding protein n=1 Tax=Agaribacterium sp. ZY112 TaxID=3233574 RepID=UPI0035246B97
MAEKSLSAGFYIVNGDHRHAIMDEMNRFRSLYPDIDLDLQLHHGEEYTKKVDQWLSQGKGPDVLYWHGGQQVKYYSDRGLLKDISAFWKAKQYDKFFSAPGRKAVEFDGGIYGIPVIEQLWGMFYRVSSMHNKGIAVPDTWASLLQACAKAKQSDATLFAFGARTPWMSHGWFDYLNLRVNGLEYHRALLDGDISFLDSGVISSLEHWKELLDKGCFNANFDEFTKDSAFPLLYHERAFMILTFSRARLPEKFDGDFAFAEFPSINKDIPQYTVAPVEVFMVPAYAQWSEQLELMLDFLASAEFQEGFNSTNRLTSANKLSQPPNDKLAVTQDSYLRSSPGGIQYFDRDTRFDFAQHTPEIFIDFMRDRDVKRCAQRLESLRLKVFSN